MRWVSPVLLACGVWLAQGKIYFHETFDDDPFKAGRWVASKWKEGEGLQGKFDLSSGELYHDKKADQGLKTTQDARFYTASAKFPSFSNKGKPLVVQFQTKNEQNIECGGNYIKLGPDMGDQTKFSGDTKYNIMFGPDQCGSATRKTHLIFHYGGKNLDRKKDLEMKGDTLSHLYTLILQPDNTYEVRIDTEKVASGSLYEDWDFLPPKRIKDPKVSKPKDWVDDKEIDDPNDKKPTDWVDQKQIPDPNAKKPEDWDDEEDGEWTPPMIDNPAFKGEWKPKRIPNPAYKGEWEHPMIDNPDYKEDKEVYKYDDFSWVGVDVWQVKAGTIYDNILLGDDVKEAEDIAKRTFVPLRDAEKKKKEAKDKAEEEERKRRLEEDKKKAADKKDEEEDEDEEEDDKKDEL